MSEETLTTRLAACESELGRLRQVLAIGTVGVVSIAVLMLTAFARGSAGVSIQVIPDSLRVHELIVVDSAGVVRARIGGNLPAIDANGKRVSRQQPTAGVLLFDNTGRERGGYVTFGNGVVGLTLDTHGEQVALFAADSTPHSGGVARLWLKGNSTEMRVDESGPHFTVDRNGAVAFMAPEMTKSDAAGFCSDFRDEFARLSAPPPAADVLAACRTRASDEVCKKCLQSPRLTN